jgi:hypothetical protein
MNERLAFGTQLLLNELSPIRCSCDKPMLHAFVKVVGVVAIGLDVPQPPP